VSTSLYRLLCKRCLLDNSACTIYTTLADMDLVLEGEATRVRDPAVLEEAAIRYRAGGPAEVGGDAYTVPFSAPSARPPPWHLHRFICGTSLGVATAEPHDATRWRFAGGPVGGLSRAH
jgi:hypothetical protein